MRAMLTVFLAALCFGTTGAAQELSGVDASPMSVGAARILVGGALLAALAALSRRGGRAPAVLRAPARSPRVSADPPAPRSWGRGRRLLVLLGGAAAVVAYQGTFFAGVRSNGVAVGTVLALGSAPVLTGILESLLSRRAPTGRWMWATALAVLGAALVSGGGLFTSVGQVSPLGVLASVGAGASYALYTLGSKALLEQGMRPMDAMGGMFGLAALLSLPILLFTGASWVLTPRGLALAGWLGAVATALAYWLFSWGLARLPASTVSTITIAEPLMATLLGVTVLHETLAPLPAAGVVVLILGLLLLVPSLRWRRAERGERSGVETARIRR
ncbi:MAG: DMT family transporter [Microbacteriaceae bacterium]|jgi:DME family drug/metabolite transporter|nr:DMT family transporter [Microbacteriaceae bacterium]